MLTSSATLSCRWVCLCWRLGGAVHIQALWVEFARQHARVGRVQLELLLPQLLAQQLRGLQPHSALSCSCWR